MSRTPSAKRSWWILPASSCLLALTGCSKPPPPPPPPPPPAPEPEPEPEPIDVQSLMSRLNLEGNVSFAPDEAPVNESLAEAVLRFADAFSRGNSDEVSAMLEPESQVVLDELVNTFQWDESVAGIEEVRVVSIDDGSQFEEEPTQAAFATAIQERTGSYVLLWQADETNGSWTFNALPATAEERPNATAWDGESIADLETESGGSGSSSAGMDFILSSIPPEARAQLETLGIDVNNLDADSVQSMLDSMRATLPPEAVEAIEKLIEALRALEDGSSSQPKPDKKPEKKEEKKDGPIRKSTPGGPVTIPGTG